MYTRNTWYESQAVLPGNLSQQQAEH
ncbi:hypothetical protein WJX82_005452 [Trebouxia sp. C0006]